MVGCLGALRLATQLRPASQSLAQVLEVLLSELGRSYTTNQLSWTPIWDAGKKHHNRLGNHLADHTVDVFVGFMRKTYEQIMYHFLSENRRNIMVQRSDSNRLSQFILA